MFFKIAPFLIAVFLLSFFKINWPILKQKPLMVFLLILFTVIIILGIYFVDYIPL
jgi:preprotein translocase subunit SecE